MSNESSVLEVTTDGPAGKRVTSKAALVNASGVSIFGAASMVVAGTTYIYTGAQTTRDTVRAEVGTGGAIGSVYFSSAGKIYLKVANAGATADWAKVTTSAAD